MLNSKFIIKEIDNNIDKIKKYSVKRIGLFGSYLKGSQNKNSDIDFLVEFNKGCKTFDNYMDLKYFLEDLFITKVDLVIIDSIKEDLRPLILEHVKYAPKL